MQWRAWARQNVYSKYKRVTAPIERERYLATVAEPKLNLGCGGNVVSGWLNVDLFPTFGAIRMDGGRRWPFADGTFCAALCEHMIEHVNKPLAVYMCAETFRTLRPGAYFRVVTPDLNWFSKRILAPAATVEDDIYLRFLEKFLGKPQATWCDAINLIFYEHGHRYIWSVDELADVLSRTGFVDLQVTRAGEPVQPVFLGTEGHPREVGQLIDGLEAFAIEARKPD